MSRKFIIGFVVLALVAAIAWPKLRPLWAKAPATENKTAAAPRAAAGGGGGAALRVTTFTVTAAPLAEVIGATGTLRAEEGVDLLSEVNGKVVALNFQEGSRVHKGDLLVKLNDADLRATLQRAAWRRELAELRERRLAQLLANNSVKQDDYDAVVNDLNVQRAEVAITEAMIAKTEIRAPFDGVIGLRFVSEGAFVNATSRIATLQSLDRIKIDFAVPEKYASRIKLGSAIAFTVPGGDRKIHGEIYAIDPRIDAATRTVLLRAVCANPDGHLLPGGFANVEFALAEIPDAIVVPSIAVVPGVSDKNVFVVIDGKAVRRTVQTGTRNETTVHILDGLKAGDIVITSGLQTLRGGQAVVVAEADGAAKPARGSKGKPTSVERKPAALAQ